MAFCMGKDIPARAKIFWAHVLRRAVFDYVLYKGNRSKKTEWQCAYRYLFIEDQEYENGLSLEEVCGMFNWDPGYIRRLSTMMTREDVKRMETSSFREEYTQDVFEAFVKKSSRWKTSNFAIPFYPRMIDEFTPVPEARVVKQPSLARPVPMVMWNLNA